MELHNALASLIKYQGTTFLLDKCIVSAVDDFQGFEQHPAMKNIFRILRNDGYFQRVFDAGRWDASTQKFIPEIVRNYALPENLVRYGLECAAYALGYIAAPVFENVPSNPNDSSSNPNQPTPSSKPWSAMSKEERELFLESKIEIKADTFSYCGVAIDGVSIVIEDDEEKYLSANYEVSGKLKNIRSNDGESFNVYVSIYDIRGRLRESVLATYCESRQFNGFLTNSCTFTPNCKLDEIKKILIYADNK